MIMKTDSNHSVNTQCRSKPGLVLVDGSTCQIATDTDDDIGQQTLFIGRNCSDDALWRVSNQYDYTFPQLVARRGVAHQEAALDLLIGDLSCSAMRCGRRGEVPDVFLVNDAVGQTVELQSTVLAKHGALSRMNAEDQDRVRHSAARM